MICNMWNLNIGITNNYILITDINIFKNIGLMWNLADRF